MGWGTLWGLTAWGEVFIPFQVAQAAENRSTLAPPFEGDALFFNTADGGDVNFVAGEPVRSGGLRNASYLSMFGANDEDTGVAADKKQWWGNHVDTDTDFKYRGQTGRLLDTLPLVTANLAVINATAEDDHAWMVSLGVATSVVATSRIIGPNRIELTVAIDIEGAESEFVFVENWRAQS